MNTSNAPLGPDLNNALREFLNTEIERIGQRMNDETARRFTDGAGTLVAQSVQQIKEVTELALNQITSAVTAAQASMAESAKIKAESET